MGRSPTNTKEKLIETARELIWRESYNAVSVDEICKKADVKKGSFYHFFSSKADLAFETMDSGMKETIKVYDEIFSPERPPLERFRLMVEHVISQQKEMQKHLGHVCGCPFATLGSEMAAQDEEIGEKINKICEKKTQYHINTLKDLAAQGLIDSDSDAETKSKEIFALVIGQLMMARISNDLAFLESNLESALYDLIGVKNSARSNLKLTG